MKILKILATLFAACLLFALFAIETSKVSLTTSGSYKGIYPLFGIGIKGNLFLTGATDNLNVEDYPLAGPVITRSESHLNAKWFCRDTVHSAQLNTGTKVLNIECNGKTHAHRWSNNPPVAIEITDTVPEQLLVLSDIHGDIDYLNSVLQLAGVTDENQQWVWQQNQLVILGDSVDRGPADRRVLWRLYQLFQQAQLAGGAVHYVLGNHEQYGLDGNHFMFHPDLRAKTKTMVELSETYNQHTVIGQWLRTRPVMLRIGDFLFVHAGLSDLHLSNKLSLQDLNKGMRDHYAGHTPDEQLIALVRGTHGITKFRGQIREDKAHTPTEQQLKTILQHYGAKTLIVGHSAVEKLAPRYNGMVWPAHADHQSGQLLLINQGQIRVKTLSAKGYNYQQQQQVVRNFSLINPNDLKAFIQILIVAFTH